tara:strand:- start:277 stop:681 length:405 start_codon:yes stop_codon:yes gene_type:complete
MPNWCENTIEFYCEEGEIDKVIEFLKGTRTTQDALSGEYEYEEKEFCFDSIRPEPHNVEELGGWYEWRMRNWGCKWEPNIEYFERVDDHQLCVGLSTAWCPPERIFDAIQEKFPDLEIDWFYKEQGMRLAGWLG